MYRTWNQGPLLLFQKTGDSWFFPSDRFVTETRIRPHSKRRMFKLQEWQPSLLLHLSINLAVALGLSKRSFGRKRCTQPRRGEMVKREFEKIPYWSNRVSWQIPFESTESRGPSICISTSRPWEVYEHASTSVWDFVFLAFGLVHL